MKPCIIVDIDGTVCDARHRLHFLEKQPRDWPAFFAAMSEDKPFPAIIQLVKIMHRCGYAILFCTGRSETYRPETTHWLQKHEVPFTWIIMRRKDDYRPDVIVKREMLDDIRAGGLQPLFAIEDKTDIVKMWRMNDLPCLQVEDHAI
jgi:hypothetical protein